jgi:hypothetical protein
MWTRADLDSLPIPSSTGYSIQHAERTWAAFQPKLKLRPLRDKLAGEQAVSLIYRYRLTLLLEVSAQELV